MSRGSLKADSTWVMSALVRASFRRKENSLFFFISIQASTFGGFGFVDVVHLHGGIGGIGG